MPRHITSGSYVDTKLHACPYGYYGEATKPCTCSSSTLTKYQHRISGPLLDRIDIHVEVPRVDYEKLSDIRIGEPSSLIALRVESARQMQRERFTGTTLTCNADMHPTDARGHEPDDLSARAYHRILKLARTIADLAGSLPITQLHLTEAMQYRPRVSDL